MDPALFEQHLVWAEGESLTLYKDSMNILTIGVGHNIEERGISRAISRAILREDIQATVDDCRKLAYWDTLDSVRQLVIADMVFNLGLPKFLRFEKTNAAMHLGDYNWAAAEMIDSEWYRQTGRRARKLVKAMRTGVWKNESPVGK